MTTATEISELTQVEQLKLIDNQPTLLFFWAPWQDPALISDLREALSAISEKYPNIAVRSVEAETSQSLTENFEITVVPSYVGIYGSVVEKVEGVNPPGLAKLASQLSSISPQLISSAGEAVQNVVVNINDKLKELINKASVMLFMKGVPDAPKCGFSKKICGILKENAIAFSSFDILTDEDVRSGLKVYSDWPTYPQLYGMSNHI